MYLKRRDLARSCLTELNRQVDRQKDSHQEIRGRKEEVGRGWEEGMEGGMGALNHGYRQEVTHLAVASLPSGSAGSPSAQVYAVLSE
ncbi:hypothetical protein RRG08_024630 [Elysia crispata]|uniref:Uncharacterized protein n=1 Tax=Elysia crispata TaxID=231223 RepID=A0AAE0ZXM4_9GAST|nr:hypothetical protein RRG08_024630 [Elysia crispata]